MAGAFQVGAFQVDAFQLDSIFLTEYVYAGEDICMRCGVVYPETKLKKEWTGLKVCRDCYDPRHPQDFVRGVYDRQSVHDPRPDPTPVYLTTNQVTPDSL